MSPEAVSTTIQAVAEPLGSATSILGVGFTGFGFLLMYLAYGILRDVTKPGGNPNAAIVGVVRAFMAVSVVMAVMATGLEVAKMLVDNAQFKAKLASDDVHFKRRATLYVLLDPRDLPKAVTGVPDLDTTAQGTCTSWSQKCSLDVSDGEAVTFHIGKLVDQIRACAVASGSNLKEAAKSKPDEGIGHVPF